MSLLFGYDKVLGEWVAKRVEMKLDNMYTTIGVMQGGNIAAVCLYRNYRDHDIEMVFAADTPRWATKGNIAAFFRYPFVQLGCKRVTALVSRHNKRSRRMVEGLGFKHEGTMRKAFDGKVDLVCYGLLESECKWLKYETRM